jgi:hypothetical protein
VLVIQATTHPNNMPIAARLAFQPAMPAALTLPQHPPAAHLVSTASHRFVTHSSNANGGHYSPFITGSKPQFSVFSFGWATRLPRQNVFLFTASALSQSYFCNISAEKRFPL